MHATIIKNCLEKQQYLQAAEVISRHHFGDNYIAADAFDCLGSYFEKNDGSVGPEDLRDFHITYTMAGQKEDRKLAVKQFYEQVMSSDGGGVGRHLIESLVLRGKVEKALVDLVGRVDAVTPAVVRSAGEKLVSLAGSVESEEKDELPSVEEFCKTVEAVSKFSWSSKQLTALTQGFGPGRSALVFGLSNVGKSSFCVYEIASWLKQGLSVLDISISEDPFSRRMPRIIQALHGMRYADVMANREQLYKDFLSDHSKNYMFKYLGYGTNVKALEHLIEKQKPDVVFVDGFTKLAVSGHREVNHPKMLGIILAQLKSFAEKHQHGIIPICQAADTARGKDWLTMDMISGSKVDIPGELEMAIGLSAPAGRGMININLAKNKLGDETGFVRKLDDATCTWEDL